MSPKQQEKKFDREYAKELIRIAGGDLAAAVAISKDPAARLENAFFMAQQSIEKALKAVLVHYEVAVPLVHDLGALIAKLPSDLNSPFGYELNDLNQFATVRRYEEGHFKVTLDEFKDVQKIAETMLSWADQKLRS